MLSRPSTTFGNISQADELYQYKALVDGAVKTLKAMKANEREQWSAVGTANHYNEIRAKRSFRERRAH
jgi:hypothetical protein